MPKGRSLHIGLNLVDPGHYAGWSGPLTACEADAEDMKYVADSRKFESQILVTAEATRDAVKDAIGAAASDLKEGDIFFLSYSGHGGQVPDADGDEMDMEDETWCLYDGQLIDDELNELWSRFDRGVRVLVLSDSCHSGTVTRAAYDGIASTAVATQPVSRSGGGRAPVYRAMPDDAAFKTFRANRGFYQNIFQWLQSLGKPTGPGPTVRLISGCQDNQLSLDGTFNGLFTGTLLRVWADGRFDGNYRRFHKQILRRMPPTQSPNHFVIGPPDPDFADQVPFTI